MKKIILIAGKAEAGKSLSGRIIGKYFEEKNQRVLHIAFADFLKFTCQKYFNWDGIKNNDGRTILQKRGEVARKNNPAVWARITSEIIKCYLDDFDYFIIDDFRYPDEVSTMKFLFGKENVFLIYVFRPNHQNKLNEEQRNHHSETSLDDYKKFNAVFSMDEGIWKVESKLGLFLKGLNW